MKLFILKTVTILLLMMSFNSFSVTPLHSSNLDDVDINCDPFHLVDECLKGGWYLDYIGMQYIYDNDYDLTPNFNVGIVDSSVGHHVSIDLCDNQGQENCLVTDISTPDIDNKIIPKVGDITSHGNMVTSIFSGSKNEENGMRSIVQAKTIFVSFHSRDGDNDGLDILLLNNPSIKIVNLSFAQKANNITTGQNLSNYHNYREYISNHPDTLFVVSAGNGKKDAKKSNGALHYDFIGDYATATDSEKNDEANYVLSKLQNLIVVAANDHHGVIYSYSNYGESVDITAPSNIFAAGCNDDTQSTYLKSHSSLIDYDSFYGYEKMTPNIFFKLWDYLYDSVSASDSYDIPCSDNEPVADGTSTASPITAGAAAILLARDETLKPRDLKAYLTNTDNLIKTIYRYSTDSNSFEGKAHLCPGLTYYDYCTLSTPILNIEKSMKQYEADNTIVDDFEGDLYSFFNYARLKQYVSENNITYLATQNKYIDFYPSPNPLVANKCIRFRLISYLGAGDIFINSAKRLKKVFIRYTIYESRPNKYFGIYDENNNQVYYDNSIQNFGNFEEATFYIQDGTNSLRFSGDVDAMHIDKIEYTYQ